MIMEDVLELVVSHWFVIQIFLSLCAGHFLSPDKVMLIKQNPYCVVYIIFPPVFFTVVKCTSKIQHLN